MITRVRSLRWIGCHLLAIAAIASSKSAFAAGDREGPTYALSWSRAESARECITAQKLALNVEQRLGRSVFVSAASAEFSLEGRVERTPSGWSAFIAVQDREGNRIGQRELSSSDKDCRALDRPIALALALTIDPHAVFAETDVSGEAAPARSNPPAPASPPAPAASPPPAAPSAEPSADARERIPGNRLPAHTELGARFAFGLLPTTAVPGAHAAAVIPIAESWALRFGGTMWPPSRAVASEGGAFFSLFTGTLAFCHRRRGENAFLLACAAVEPGVMAHAAYGFTRRSSANVNAALFFGAGARAGVRLIGPLWAQVGGDVLVPAIRDQFYYVRADLTQADIFRLAAVGGAADIGLLLAFP